MQTITLSHGEAKEYLAKKKFKEIITALNKNLLDNTDPDGEIDNYMFNRLTDIAALNLGILFSVPKDTFFKAEWPMIDWWTNLTESYIYATGMVSIIRMES